jgi:hypothetical protein
MLGRALYEEFRPEIGEPKILESDLYKHSDDSLVFILSQSPSVAGTLANAILERRLYKYRNTEFELKYSRADFDTVQAHDHRENTVDVLLNRLTNPEYRRKLENHMADLIDAKAGDVIIYAPEERMNLKVAAMKVLWKGNLIPFESIDDPIIAPRLAQILSAHKLLWSVNVLFCESLDEEQVSLLRDLCDIEFLNSPNGRTFRNKNRRLLQRQIERYLRKNDYNIPSNARAYAKLKSQTADQLALAARNPGNESFQSQLHNECQEVFGKFAKAPAKKR